MAVPVGPTAPRSWAAPFIEAPRARAWSPQFDPELAGRGVPLRGGRGGALVVLVQAVNGQMLGIGRLAYSLGTQPPDPEPAVAARRPPARRPIVAIACRGRDRLRARPSAGHRVPRGDLRLRGDARVHARPPVGDRAALPRARPPERAFRVPLSACPSAGARPAAGGRSARCWGRPAWVSVVVLHEGARIAGGVWMLVGHRALRDLPARPGQVAHQALHDPGGGAEEAKDMEYGSILVPVFGEPPGRRHRGHRRPPGRRGGGGGGGRRRARGALRVRDPDVAADRRARARRAGREGAGTRWPGPRR